MKRIIFAVVLGVLSHGGGSGQFHAHRFVQPESKGNHGIRTARQSNVPKTNCRCPRRIAESQRPNSNPPVTK